MTKDRTAAARGSIPYTLQWVTPSSTQNCPFPCGIWTPSNTWFLGSTRVHTQNGITIGSAIFGRLTNMTDLNSLSVIAGHIYVRSTAMQPKNVIATSTVSSI